MVLAGCWERSVSAPRASGTTRRSPPPWSSCPSTAVEVAVGRELNQALSYLILRPWSAAFGTGESALRSLSVLGAMATVALVVVLGRRLVGPPRFTHRPGPGTFGGEALAVAEAIETHYRPVEERDFDGLVVVLYERTSSGTTSPQMTLPAYMG